MYPLTPELVDFLCTEEARRALVWLRGADLRPEATLEVLTVLRRRFSPPQAAVLLDQARLRRRAAGKFPQAQELLFTDEALQQASGAVVARYRAGWFAAWEGVADLGCGVGGDTLALAEVVPQVVAVEREPVRARLAAVNVAAVGLAQRVRVLCADWVSLLREGRLGVEAAFADPSRRVDDGRGGRRRVFSLRLMEPPLAVVLEAQARLAALAVKVSPGVALAEVPPQAEVEFISVRGRLKEAVLRFGALRLGAARRATLLPGPHHLDSRAACGEVPVCEPGRFLYEPDPAVLRAGLVRHLATRLGAAQLDPTIAYLTADVEVVTPWARCWRVLRHGRFRLKVLRRWVREVGAGEVVVKRRGVPPEPEVVRRQLPRVAGGPSVTVFLTRVRGRRWMVLARAC